MQGYPPPPPGGGGPPGGGPPGGPYDPNFYGQQPPGGAPGYGPPGQQQQQPYGAPQQPYGAPQGQAYGAPPGGSPYGAPPGYGPPGAMMAQGGAPFGVDPLSGMPYSDKSKMVAGILQLFVGSFGAGRWYTGHTGIAIAQLLTCGGFGLWALIDAILMFTGKVPDAQGRPLRD